MLRSSWLFLLIVLPLCSAHGVVAQTLPASQPAAPMTQDDRLALLRKLVEQTVTGFEAEMAKPGAKLEARQFTQYAYYSLVLGNDPAKAEAALKRALALQDMKDSNSPHYGEFAPGEGMSAQPEAPVPTVPGAPPGVGAALGSSSSNTEPTLATEFTVLPIAQIVLRYGERVSPEMRQQLTDRLKASLKVIRKRELPLDAANVYLLNAVDLLLIGEIVSDEPAMSVARSRLDAFIGVCRSRGLSEYVAPNYTAVQLGCLLIGHSYTHQPEARRQLEMAIRFMWSQVAANVVPRRGLLGGPHSRDFNFPFGAGSIDAYLFLEGLSNVAPPSAPFDEGLHAFTTCLEGAYRPEKSILDLASLVDRVVAMRWGLMTGMDRYFYVTEGYAIGSSSATFCPYDKKLTVEFCSPKVLPTIWYVPDFFDAPYGYVKNRTGQMIKPIHLREQIAAVQEKNAVLALMNLRADVKGTPLPSVASNIIIPARADHVFLDGKLVAMDKPFEAPVNPDSTVIVHEGSAAAVVRFFATDGIAGQQPKAFLKYDGNPWGMARLVVYHYKGTQPVRLPDEPVRVGVIMLAGKCSSTAELRTLAERAAAAKVEHDVQGRAWRAKLVDGATTLEAGLDLQTGNILTRRVNGNDYSLRIFQVNERDLVAELLGL